MSPFKYSKVILWSNQDPTLNLGCLRWTASSNVWTIHFFFPAHSREDHDSIIRGYRVHTIFFIFQHGGLMVFWFELLRILKTRKTSFLTTYGRNYRHLANGLRQPRLYLRSSELTTLKNFEVVETWDWVFFKL